MARRLRTVGRDFTDSAPMRLVFAAEVSAPGRGVPRARRRCRVLAVLVHRRHPGHARRRGRGPGGAVRGGVRFRETIVATDPGHCYAYRVDETNAPGLRALLEEWRLTPEGSGTRVQWTFAADGTGLFRLVLSLGRAGVGRSFRDAVRRLDTRLATTTP
ncbi:polyketide cyclase [Streptomyces badius]